MRRRISIVGPDLSETLRQATKADRNQDPRGCYPSGDTGQERESGDHYVGVQRAPGASAQTGGVHLGSRRRFDLWVSLWLRAKLEIPKEQVAEFCRRHHIHKLALFGSVLRDDFQYDSDVDVLVEFEPGFVPGLEFFALETELSQIFGRRVDLNTPSFLSKYFRDRALAEAEVQYVAP
jgi:predicted nucleotidyltransferase